MILIQALQGLTTLAMSTEDREHLERVIVLLQVKYPAACVEDIALADTTLDGYYRYKD